MTNILIFTSISLYITGAFITYLWWKEVSSYGDKNWVKLITIISWPITSFVGMVIFFTDWLER